MSRSAATGRVAVSGRVAASGRVSALSRHGYPFTLGLRAYYRADPENVTISNGKVTKLADISGNGNHVSQGTSTRRPTWTGSWLNGNPAITFAGSQVLVSASALFSSRNPWTMGGVWQATSISGTRGIFFYTALGAFGLTINTVLQGNREIYSVGVGQCQCGTANTNPEVWVATGSTNANPILTDLALRLGVSDAVQTVTPSTISSAAPAGGVALLGAVTTAAQVGFVGQIGEVFFVDRILSSAERAGYLAYVQSVYGSI